MGVSLEAWRQRIGCFGCYQRTKNFQWRAPYLHPPTGLGLCFRLALFLLILLVVAGDVETNPGPNNRQYTHKDESYSIQDVLDILRNPDWNRIIRVPPIKPRAGQVFLYHYDDEKKKDDWRCDQYHFKHDGNRKQPRSKPQLRKSFFVIKNPEGKKDMRFRKHAYKLLQDHNNLVLIQYLGDESVAVDLPHGNSKDKTNTYTRVCPSTIVRMKESSCEAAHVLKQLKDQALETSTPEIHQPRSLLHVRNTKCRLKRKLDPTGKKTRRRKRRKIEVTDMNVAAGVNSGHKICSLNQNNVTDVVVADSTSPDLTSPHNKLTELAVLCDSIYLDNTGNQATYVPPGSDTDDPLSLNDDRHLTELTAAQQDITQPSQHADNVQAQNKKLQYKTVTCSEVYSDSMNITQCLDETNNQTFGTIAPGETATGMFTERDFVISVQGSQLNSQNDQTAKYPKVTDTDGRITESQGTSINCVVTCTAEEEDERSSSVSGLVPSADERPDSFECVSKSYANIMTTSVIEYVQQISSNRVLDQVLASLKQFLNSQADSISGTTISQEDDESAHSSQNISENVLTCGKTETHLSGMDNGSSLVKNRCTIKHSKLTKTTSHRRLPETVTSLIAQVSDLWKEEYNTTEQLLTRRYHKTGDTLCVHLSDHLSLVASLIVGAYRTGTDIMKFLETIKEYPSHISQFCDDNVANYPLQEQIYKIGNYTLYAKDIKQLEDDGWLDDSVIHAYLHLLQRQHSANTGRDVLVLECFLYTKMENLNYDGWLYKETSFARFDWIMFPICRSHHWVLLLANVREGKVSVINSKPSSSTETVILNYWRQYMQRRSEATGEMLQDWQSIQYPVFPQTDGSSCGVYVLMAAEAILEGAPVAIFRNCHVMTYRNYIKSRLLNVADKVDVQETGQLLFTDPFEMQTENLPDLRHSSDISGNGTADGMFTTGQDSMMDCTGISELLRQILLLPSVSEKHVQDTWTDPLLYQELFKSHKTDFAVVIFLCLEKGQFDLNNLTTQSEHNSPLETHINWSCVLSGSHGRQQQDLKKTLCWLRDYISPKQPVIKFRHNDAIQHISNMLSNNAYHFITNIDLKFLHKYVVLHDNTLHDEESKTFLIKLDKSKQSFMVNRIAHEILNQNFAFTLSHSACSKHGFTVSLVKRLIDGGTIENIVKLSDKVFQGSFLHWTCFCNNAHLYMLLSVYFLDRNKEELAIACTLSGNKDILQLVSEETDLHCIKTKTPSIAGFDNNHDIANFDTHNLPLFHLACYYGHRPIITCLLECGFHINEQLNSDFVDSGVTPAGSTPVGLAASRGHADAVWCLIDNGADLDLVDCNYNSPLHLACRGGHGGVVDVLINKCKLAEQNSDGNTPLHLACITQREDVACLLLRGKSDISVVNYHNNTPLDIVCQNGCYDIVDQLLLVCPNPMPHDGSNTPLHKACRGGYDNITSLLLKHDADKAVNNDDLNPLTLAVESGNQHIAHLLINKTRGKFIKVLHTKIAVEKQKLDIFKLLIEKDVNVLDDGYDGGTLLTTACSNGHMEIVKLLIEKGADVSADGLDGDTPLTAACSNGHMEIVKLLIEKGIDVSADGRYGDTPLTAACSNGHMEIVKLLIEKGIDVSADGRYGDTPLTAACSNGHMEIVKLLIEKGIDVSADGRYGDTPLRAACSNGHMEIVKLLIEKGADVSANEHYGNTPLRAACSNGHMEIVKLLIEKGADVSAHGRYGNTPLRAACFNGHKEIVKLLIEKGADVSAHGLVEDTPLRAACSNGHMEIVKLLIEKGADVSADGLDGDTPLTAACRNGHMEIVKLLIEKGADVSAHGLNGNTPLRAACSNGHMEIVKLLIEKWIDVSDDGRYGNTPLTKACFNGHMEIVKLLIEKGADVSAHGRNGDTPLTKACFNGHMEIVKLLIEKGADVSAHGRYGDTPLTAACRNGHMEIVKLLIEKGADVSAHGRYGDTPLTAACRNGHMEIVKLLIEKGADVSAHGRYGDTPLTAACRNGHMEIVKLLIEKGADVSADGLDGDTPLTAACSNGHMEIVKLLIEKGIDVSADGFDGDTALTAACSNGHMEIVKLLIEKGIDVSADGLDGDTPLTAACSNGHMEIVKLLIEKGIDVSADGFDGDTALTAACSNGHMEIVKLLIEKGADVSADGLDGDTPLTAACSNGHMEIVKLLIEKGIDVSAHGLDGDTALTAACRNGHMDIVKLLIEKGADVSAHRLDGDTPLTAACRNGHMEIVKLLIEKGIDVSAHGLDGDTPLRAACSNGRMDIVKLLIEKGADVSADGRYGDTPLTKACRNGHMEIVKLLIEKGADVSADGRYGDTPLRAACSNDHMEIVKLLIEKVADLPKNRFVFEFLKGICYQPNLPATILRSFSLKGEYHIVRLLIENLASDLLDTEYCGQLLIEILEQRHTAMFLLLSKKIDTSQSRDALLLEACTHGQIKICEHLLKHGDGVDGKCLIASLKIQNVKLTEVLLDKGADVSACDDDMNSALHLACSLGDCGIVDRLVKGGVSVSATNRKLQTPLHIACENGNLDIMQRLLLEGADYNKMDCHGNTVVHVACAKRNVQILECLLQYLYKHQHNLYGYVMNGVIHHVLTMINKRKETPLIIACARNNLDVVKLLLKQGVFLTDRGEHDKTALHIACEKGNLLILESILEHYNHIQSMQFTVTTTNPLLLVDENGESVFHVACRKYSVSAVKLLLKYKVDIFQTDRKGHTPVSYAQKSLDIFHLLCHFSKELSTADCEGNTLLHVACQKDWSSCVSILLERRANVSASNSRGECPVHKAAESDNMDIMQILLSHRCSINVCNTDGQTPLHIACAESSPEVVGFLLQNGATINAKDTCGLSPLHIACKEGRSNTVDVLIRSGAEIDITDVKTNSPLFYACEEGHSSCVSILLKNNANVNMKGFRGNSPLHRSSAQGHEVVVSMLLSCGADPVTQNNNGHTPLYHAILHNHLAIVNRLLDSSGSHTGTSLNNHTLLHTACTRGHVDVLKALFSRLSLALDSPMASLLQAAVEAKHLDIVHTLEEYGCDVKQKDRYGYSILHLVCSSENSEPDHLQLVLDIGLNLSETTKSGETTLHLASQCGNANIVKCILDRGISVASKDNAGSTALHAACSCGHFAIAQLLIQKQLSLNEMNAKGMTPLDDAISNKHYGVTCLYDQWFTLTGTYPRISIGSLRYICNDKQIQLLHNSEMFFSDKDSEGNSPLHIAIEEEATEILQLLIISGAWLVVRNSSGDAPIHVACHKSFDILKALLDIIYDGKILREMISICDKDGNSPLHIVAREGDISSICLLLDKGADVYSVNNFGQTPLHVVCYGGKLNILSLLLRAQGNITAKDKDGNTPLHIICIEGNLKALELTGYNIAYITCVNYEERTPFHEAVRHGHYSMVREMMLQYFQIDDIDGRNLEAFVQTIGTDNFVQLLMDEKVGSHHVVETPLREATETGCQGIVAFLLNRIHTADVPEVKDYAIGDVSTNQSFHISIQKGHTNIVELYLGYKQNVNERTGEGETPLHLACRYGHVAVAEILLKAGSDITSTDTNKNTVLHLAAMSDHPDIITLLSKWGMMDTRVNEAGDLALHLACKHGHIEAVKQLLKLDSDITQENNDKRTSLSLVCESGFEVIAELLLRKLRIKSRLLNVDKPEVFTQSEYSKHLYVCLQYASSQNRIGIIKQLLEFGAEVNPISDTLDNSKNCEINESGGVFLQQTPLYTACQIGNPDTAELLIQSGAMVDTGTDCEYTPLHIASAQGHSEIVSLLLKWGASPLSDKSKHITPLHCACQQGHQDVVEILLGAGFDPKVKDRNGKTPLDVCYNEEIRNKLLTSMKIGNKRKTEAHRPIPHQPEKVPRYQDTN